MTTKKLRIVNTTFRMGIIIGTPRTSYSTMVDCYKNTSQSLLRPPGEVNPMLQYKTAVITSLWLWNGTGWGTQYAQPQAQLLQLISIAAWELYCHYCSEIIQFIMKFFNIGIINFARVFLQDFTCRRNETSILVVEPFFKFYIIYMYMSLI